MCGRSRSIPEGCEAARTSPAPQFIEMIRLNLPIAGSYKEGNLFFEEFPRFNPCLFQNCPQCSFGHISRMVGNGGKSSTGRIVPDLMASRRITEKLKAKGFELLDNFPVFEA